MRAEPRVRRDGKCAHCKGPRKPPEKSSSLPRAREEAIADPFCSTACCKAYHRIDNNNEAYRQQRAKPSKPTILERIRIDVGSHRRERARDSNYGTHRTDRP